MKLPGFSTFPRFGENGTASRCCPGPAWFWRPRCAGWRPPCGYDNWCGQPQTNWHPWLVSGDPALERWPHNIYRIKITAASPVRNSHPQECFTADLSVFQAHLPARDGYDITRHAKPLLDSNLRGGKNANTGASAMSSVITRLTVGARGATVIAVAGSRTSPSGTLLAW